MAANRSKVASTAMKNAHKNGTELKNKFKQAFLHAKTQGQDLNEKYRTCATFDSFDSSFLMYQYLRRLEAL